MTGSGGDFVKVPTGDWELGCSLRPSKTFSNFTLYDFFMSFLYVNVFARV